MASEIRPDNRNSSHGWCHIGFGLVIRHD